MKVLLAFLLIITGCANAKNAAPLKEVKFTQYECKQKVLPLDIEYRTEKDSMTIHLKAESEIKQFKVLSVRGIDGLEIVTAKKPATVDLNKADSLEILADIKQPEGLSYIVLDLEGKLKGRLKKQTLAIPVGEAMKEVKATNKDLSQPQGKKRKIMRIE